MFLDNFKRVWGGNRIPFDTSFTNKELLNDKRKLRTKYDMKNKIEC